MPIHSGTDKDGSFYQWGSTGKKYHFNPNDKKSRQNALRKAKAQQTAIYSSGWKGDNNMADKMKLIKVKTGDAKPSMRVKAAGNVFVEVYKDSKGFFYKIDVPGQTGYESKERFQDQNKALSSGTAHAKQFIASIKIKKDANSREEILKQIDDTLKDMHPGMDKISKAIKALRSIDKDVANDKQAVFNKLTFAYYELGSK